ncbi:MAG: cation diffusion facilitator family transporter [Peptococcaceae bacterium]|nr:cation diffusion facilitator family transporter [Peptococcaceae bacterium]
MEQTAKREQTIIRASILGILTNLLLVAFKGAVGMISGSIAILMDAVNNLTDVLSSVVTIVGTKMAGRAPDRGHPIGHGRLEYLTTMVVALIILYAGVTAFVESAKKIIHPAEVHYSLVTLVILTVAVAAKLALGTFVRSRGRAVGSGALEASGLDALYDAIISASVLLSALIYMATGVGLEAFVGVGIAVMITKSGIDMLGSAVNSVMGKRVSSKLSREVKATAAKVDGVLQVNELYLNDYGPNTFVGCLNVEVEESLNGSALNHITHHIQKNVYKEHGVVLVSVGFDAVNVGDQRILADAARVKDAILSEPGVLEMHGFIMDTQNQFVHLDAVVDFSVKDLDALHASLVGKVKTLFPGWRIKINIDPDLSD